MGCSMTLALLFGGAFSDSGLVVCAVALPSEGCVRWRDLPPFLCWDSFIFSVLILLPGILSVRW